jgi:transcriptional regulator with XRE-family HTH domain
MKDRIIKFITSEGLTATRFADEIGVQRSSVSHILSGRNNPSFEFIQKILNRYRNINAEWLIQGNGAMYKKNETIPATDTLTLKNPVQTDENQLNLFKNPTPPQNLSSTEEVKINTSSIQINSEPSRKVEKIVLFYSDKTFDEFFPSK